LNAALAAWEACVGWDPEAGGSVGGSVVQWVWASHVVLAHT